MAATFSAPASPRSSSEPWSAASFVTVSEHLYGLSHRV